MNRRESIMELNIEEIMEILPHRYPMLLVDKITELVPMDYAVGVKSVTINEPFFQGHFPAGNHSPPMRQQPCSSKTGNKKIKRRAKFP